MLIFPPDLGSSWEEQRFYDVSMDKQKRAWEDCPTSLQGKSPGYQNVNWLHGIVINTKNEDMQNQKKENRVNICPNAETGTINKEGEKKPKQNNNNWGAVYQDKCMKQFRILGASKGVKWEMLTGWL